ncbi:hypothetical protein H4R34_006056 [Dimargaris verticillata]|uniref:HAD-like domain-containing protein n=1 Tax=Dimargaris verticillata TaxID=2761393 RepID=A0A9W8AVS4_9FUNG|nr:hypothetical protein H4R34_006056 [Dimargaris verticillata]
MHPWQQFTGRALEYTLFGKPHTATYDFAIRTLDAHVQELASSYQLTPPPTRRYYAIGDNPHSDIMGANAHGWCSILVKTGVFQGHTQDEADSTLRAQYLVNDVDEALDLILSLESGKARS